MVYTNDQLSSITSHLVISIMTSEGVEQSVTSQHLFKFPYLSID